MTRLTPVVALALAAWPLASGAAPPERVVCVASLPPAVGWPALRQAVAIEGRKAGRRVLLRRPPACGASVAVRVDGGTVQAADGAVERVDLSGSEAASWLARAIVAALEAEAPPAVLDPSDPLPVLRQPAPPDPWPIRGGVRLGGRYGYLSSAELHTGALELAGLLELVRGRLLIAVGGAWLPEHSVGGRVIPLRYTAGDVWLGLGVAVPVGEVVLRATMSGGLELRRVVAEPATRVGSLDTDSTAGFLGLDLEVAWAITGGLRLVGAVPLRGYFRGTSYTWLGETALAAASALVGLSLRVEIVF